VALGFVTLIAGLLISPSLVAWMSPTIAGLILAIFLSWGSGMLSLGLALKRMGLLLTPEETIPPPVATRANGLAAELASENIDEADGILAIHADPEFRAIHEAFLPPYRPHVRGVVDPDRAVAEAKLNDADSAEEAARWLRPRERNVVLQDRALIALLARLPRTAPARVE
jgi:membrane glycosyltransferase